ncbi:MAG: DUF1648 domain-containing protein [Clostridia bacterium]|nr:DUF1648 domain-containing protein [Clostridia bacterium]
MGTLFRKNLAYLRPYHWVLEALAVLLGLAAVVVALVGRSKLPADVPTHWDFQGNPDGYGSPTTFLLFPVIMLLAILATSAIIHVVDVSRWNMPFQIKPGRKVPVARTFIALLLAMNIEFGAFSLWFTLRTVQLNMEGTAGGIVAFVVALTVTLIAGIVLATMRNR